MVQSDWSDDFVLTSGLNHPHEPLFYFNSLLLVSWIEVFRPKYCKIAPDSNTEIGVDHPDQQLQEFYYLERFFGLKLIIF